jgi:hypothetical protein
VLEQPEGSTLLRKSSVLGMILSQFRPPLPFPIERHAITFNIIYPMCATRPFRIILDVITIK